MGLINIIKGARKGINNNRFGHLVNGSKFGQNLEEHGLRAAINDFSILGRINNSASGQFVEYMFAPSPSLDFNVTRYILKGAGVAALAAGCSSKEDDRDLLGPSMGNETVLSGAYEGSIVNVDVDVSDPAGINSVKVLYRLSGSTDTWTEAAQLTPSSGDTYSGSFVMPVSESYDFFIEGNDSLGNVSSTLEQTVDSWANEANAETEIIAKLAEFKANGDIDDYWGPDYTFPLADATTITVDASLIDLSSPTNPIKTISYKGESDTDLTAYLNEISRLNADSISVTDIRAMIQSRLPTEMDDAQEADWVDNTYVERPDYLKQGLKTAGKAVLASAPVALGIGLCALIAGEEKVKELGKKVGRFFKTAVPVILGGAIVLTESKASAEEKPARDNIEERIENGKRIKTVYNKNGVARIEETTEDKSKYKTDIYKLDWHTAEQKLVGVEEGIIQNNQNVRLKTQYFNIEQEIPGVGKEIYNIIADHEKKTVELNKTS